MDQITFSCTACGKDWQTTVYGWNYEPTVTCPHCGTFWSTDYDESDEVGLIGPWITEISP